MSSNPYSPPQANMEAEPVLDPAPPLWNPNAAACWSLLFSPIFGALLHMKNWEALGRPEEAKKSGWWAIGSLAFYLLSLISGALMPESKLLDGLDRFGGFALLLAWYGLSARDQVQFLTFRHGPEYPRKGWGKPLLYGVLVLVALFAATALVVGFSEAAGFET